MSSFRYIPIHSTFTENRRRSYKSCSLEHLIEMLEDSITDNGEMRNSDCSLFEITNYKVIPFFDIETIPEEKGNDYIYKIADNLMSVMNKFSNEKITKYYLTQNKKSSNHKGLSYHLYYPEYYTNKKELKKLVNYYIENKNEGADYLDCSAYSADRLFRLPFQYGISKFYHRDENPDRLIDYHKPLDEKYDLKNYIINNIDNKKEIRFESIPMEYVYKRAKNIISGVYPPRASVEEVCNKLAEGIESAFNKQQKAKLTDEMIYNTAISLKELLNEQEEKHKKYINMINEYITFYDNNKSFEKFRINKEQINIILEIIKSKL